jgi:Putative peptidoglycan binding domain
MLHRFCTLVWLAALVAIPVLPTPAMAQSAGSQAGAPALSPRLLADASWHGRPIQRPLARRSDVSDRAAGLRPGTGYVRPGGSRRVRDLQRRLSKLGYRPGARDGLYGPRTQAAVLAFQRKHGLQQTGTVGAATLQVLRRRSEPGGRAPQAEPVQAQQPQPAEPRPATPRDTTPPQAPVVPAQATDGGLSALTTMLLLALALPLLMLTGLLLRRRRTRTAVCLERRPERLALAVGDPPATREIPEVREDPVPEVREDPVPDQEVPPVRKVPRMPHASSQERRTALRERILAMRGEGMTLQQIADLLTEEGEPTLGGVRQWQPWSVRAATRPVDPRGRHIAHGHGKNGGDR